MTIHDRKTFVLINPAVRRNALDMVRDAAEYSVVTVTPKTRSNEQNAKLHALLSDLARSDIQWAGKTRSLDEWKALMISAHSVATKHHGEIIPGIEGEFVAIRESSATMSVSRAASLIEYITAFCVSHGVELRDTRKGGFESSSAPPPADDVGSEGAAPSDLAADPSPSQERGAVEEGDNPGDDAAPSSNPFIRSLMEECIDNMLRDAFSDPAAQRLAKIEKATLAWLRPENLGEYAGFVNRCAETARRVSGNHAERPRASEYLRSKIEAACCETREIVS